MCSIRMRGHLRMWICVAYGWRGIIARFHRLGTTIIAVSAMAPPLAGCAVSYDDSLGHRHVIGFVDMSVVPVPQGGTLAGNVIAIKSLGAFVSTDQNQTVVGLGYTSESTAAIQDNSMVLGNPNAALASILEGER